jgi:hypothetical protein
VQDRLESHGVDYAAAAASILAETINNELVNDQVHLFCNYILIIFSKTKFSFFSVLYRVMLQ